MGSNGTVGETHRRLEEFRRQPLPDDVVGAVFVYSEADKVSSDLRMLQSFFYDLSRDPDYRDLMTDFEFSADRYPYPFSHDLEPALGRLQNRKIINAHNPAFDWYGIEHEGRERMKSRVGRKFSEAQQRLLKTAGKRLREHEAAWGKRADQTFTQ